MDAGIESERRAAAPSHLPLTGVVVVDLSRYIAGPYCSMLMADAGATVIKVEPPRGEDTRSLEPYVADIDGSKVSAYFLRMNRNKRSVTLDLKSEPGQRALADLISRADVLLENYRPGVLARFGFDQERLSALNTGLVYCTISGFGHTKTPMRDRPAYNVVAEYEAGVYYQRDPNVAPAPIGPPVGDLFPALHALGGLLMALYRKAVTGQGGRVDIAMFDSMLSLNEIRSSYAKLYGRDWDPAAHPFYSPYGVFPVRDGHICIDVTTDPQWRGFCAAIGRPDLYALDGMATGPERVERFDSHIKGPLDAWLATQDRDLAVATLTEHHVPSAAIRHPGEALESDQSHARGMEVTVRSSGGAQVSTVGTPIKIDRWQDLPIHAAGADLGADTEAVLREVAGWDQAAIDHLLGRVLTATTPSEGAH
ncbi:MAG: CoA transferase [Intrasporangium sp.]|uniref:CaiB/BaiF CoA transferase family protein n=1 Tax=Intrasporangium sp. TaxID=1925024 RepID=UPI002647DD69|nr:CaiB/BaiF CoA-transferase family protein [Intrasporangium sp.]MDN5796878.1 CoA transferase [Intrasporangium sp.]